MAGWSIVDLAQHPDWLEEIVGWHHAEWLRLSDAATMTHAQLAQALHERGNSMRTHLTADPLPTTFVAQELHKPIGTVSLIRYGSESNTGKVWLTNLYVQPARRYQGVGQALLAHGEAAARAFGLLGLWLYSFDSADYYRKRGWCWEKTAEIRGCPVEVLYKTLV